MLIKYGNIDVTHRLLEYKLSGSFADGYLIGNVPTMQLNLKFDNYDGILDDLDINEYWEIQETDLSEKRYFKVYDQPEKYTKTLSLKLYDDAHELDVAYDTKLSYPVTIQNQIEEIETLTGFMFDTSNLPEDVLSKQVSWYDNTIAIRNYLGWIAEISGANLFATGKGVFSFELFSKNVFAETDTLTNFEKNESYKLTRVYFENGINPIYKGDETGNTLFLDSNNLYLTDEQNIIDRLYDQLIGLEFYSAKSIDMIGIDNLHLGHVVDYTDNFKFVVIEIENTFKGGDFLYTNVDGTVTTKNEERVIKKITNSTRIRKLQITQDQEKLKLDIVAKEVENNSSKIGELIVSNEEISSSIVDIYKEITNIDTSLFTYELLNDGTDITNDTNVVLSANVFNKGEDITDTLEDIAFKWIRQSKDTDGDQEWNENHKATKNVTLTADDVNVSAVFYCQITMDFGIQRTQSITITDQTDIAQLDNSFLDFSGASHIQQLNDGMYFPDYTKTPISITPSVVDGMVNVDLNECEITFKRLENGQEVNLVEGENVTDGVLTVSKNLMDENNAAITYVCEISYKNSTIRRHESLFLNVIGADGEDAILLNIHSSNGLTFKNTKIATTFTVTIHVAGNLIDTSQKMHDYFGERAQIRWKVRYETDDDYSYIPDDDPRLSDNGFIFTLTADDISNRATFDCELEF